jgi:hypothetical protein
MLFFTEYIKRSGRRNASARHLLAVGRFTTTQKINGRWYIDENEPYPNARDFVHFTLTSRRLLETFKRKGYINAECARRPHHAVGATLCGRP